MKNSVKAAVLAAGLALPITAAYAHGGATGIIKERMDAMVAMADVVKALSAMMRGETDYDADTVRQGAGVIRSHAGETMTKLFPEGSGGMPSEAREEVWSDWETFAALAARLERFAAGLEQAAENERMMAPGSGGMMGQGGIMGGGTGNMMGGGGSMMGSRQSMMRQGMMGQGMMGADAPMPELSALSQMPPDGLFNMVAQTCSACHTQFRIEKKN